MMKAKTKKMMKMMKMKKMMKTKKMKKMKITKATQKNLFLLHFLLLPLMLVAKDHPYKYLHYYEYYFSCACVSHR